MLLVDVVEEMGGGGGREGAKFVISFDMAYYTVVRNPPTHIFSPSRYPPSPGLRRNIISGVCGTGQNK
jgi:hypothetical protein